MNSGPLTQPRQLVEEWSAANNAYVHALAKDDLVTRIASLTSEAATAALEQAAQIVATIIDGKLARTQNLGIQLLRPHEIDSLRTEITAEIRQLASRSDAAIGDDKP